jgi:hypothetical protein
MEIRQLYKNVLKSVNLDIDNEGLISMNVMGEKFPATVDGKRMVFPTEEVLRAGVTDNIIAFHPLSENIIRGESPVIKKLRALMVYHISEVTFALLDQLIHIAADKDYHAKLSPTQSEFLSLAPRADAKTVKAFEKIMGVSTTDGDNRLASIYMKRGGHWKGNKYSRVAVMSFPITDDFDSNESEIFGVKLRKNDKEAFKNLFLYILPNAESLEEYSHGSNSMTAPYFHALLKSYLKVVKQLNKITKRFKKHLANADDLLIDTDWESEIDDLSVYRDLIPSLKGNEGNLVNGEEPAPVADPKSHMLELAAKVAGSVEPPAPVTTPVPQVAQPVQHQAPAPAPQPQQSGGNGIPWDQVMARNPAFQQQAPMWNAQQTPWNAPPPPPPTTRGGYTAQPAYNPYQQPQPYGQPQYGGQPPVNQFQQPVQNQGYMYGVV